MQEETVICLHSEVVTSATHIGKCRICGQQRLYDEIGGVKIIKRGRIDGVLTMVVPPSMSNLPIKKKKVVTEKKEEIMSEKTAEEEAVAAVQENNRGPVPSKPSGRRGEVKAYWEKNKEDILADYVSMKLIPFLKRWHLPTSTWPKLKKLWGVEPKGHRGGRRAKAPVVKEEKMIDQEVDLALTEHERYLVLVGYQQAIREILAK